MEFFFNIPYKMLSSKCPGPEFHDIDSTKILKTASVKENVPPDMCEILDKNCNSRDYEHLKTTPKKHVERDDPVTPNTNFKMLTSIAAGLDYASCNTPKSKSLFENDILPDNLENIDSLGCRVNRKEKSLAIISSRFLSMYPLYPEENSNIIVSLDDACLKLGVERRRLYDIVNVFESIDMLQKLAKNKYLWFGKTNLRRALCNIKIEAAKENIRAKLQYVIDHEGKGMEFKQSCILDEVQEFTQTFEAETLNSSIFRSFLQQPSLPEPRKEKSLAIMSQKFLMLFLVSPFKVISLGIAAKVLNGFQRTERPAQIKTQIRRLYDIANVLSSIGLIQKEITISVYGRRPSFRYIGPSSEELENLSDKLQYLSSNVSKKLKNETSRVTFKRYNSFQEMCAVAEIEHKRICLEETANSAPPFEKSILKSDKTFSETSFSNLILSDIKSVKTSNKKSSSNQNTNCSSPLQNILPKVPLEDKNNSSQTKPLPMDGQENLKVINTPKQMFPTKGTYYILNPTSNNGVKSLNASGTILLISPLPITDTTSQNKAQKDNMPKTQPEMILQPISSLQQSKQAHDASRSKSPRRNLTKMIKEMQAADVKSQVESVFFNHFKSPSKEISLDDNDSNESYGICNSNSPCSSRMNSPLSIPSGYTTPVSNISSNLSSMSNSAHPNLKHIDNQLNCDEVSENLAKKDSMGQRSTNKNFTQNIKSNVDTKIYNSIKSPLCQSIKKLPILYNNGSSDSINSEVSEILKDKKLGDDTGKLQTFLIDEKTIFSPIKNKGEIINKTVSPSPFITPPYAPSDTIFQFKNLELKKYQ